MGLSAIPPALAYDSRLDSFWGCSSIIAEM